MVTPVCRSSPNVGARSQCSSSAAAGSGTHPGPAEILSYSSRYTRRTVPGARWVPGLSATDCARTGNDQANRRACPIGWRGSRGGYATGTAPVSGGTMSAGVGDDGVPGDVHGTDFGPLTPEQSTADAADLQAGIGALAGLVAGSLGLPELLAEVAGFAVRAIPGADGAGVTLLRLDRVDNMVEELAASAPFVAEIDHVQYVTLNEGPCITAALERRTVRSGSLGGEKMWPRSVRAWAGWVCTARSHCRCSCRAK